MELQKVCCICLNKDLICRSENVVVSSEILKLLRFLIVNVNIEALENGVVGMGCLEKIADAGEYKYKNLKISSRNKRIRSISKDNVLCQKCERVIKKQKSYRLIDCMTHVDWSDFVSYLFKNPDLEKLGNSHVCYSCRISVMNMQDVLKLLYIYDQSKVSAKSEVEDLISTENVFDSEQINNDYISYEDFKLKNEEVDLKFECDHDNADTDQSSHGCETMNVGTEISSDDSYINSAGKEKEQDMNCLDMNDLGNVEPHKCRECEVDSHTNEIKMCDKNRSGGNVGSNELTYHSTKNLKSIFKAKNLIVKLNANDHFSLHKRNSNYETVKNCRSIETRKLYKCDLCDYQNVLRCRLSLHKLTHGITDGFQIYKCYHCTYETFNRCQFVGHIKTHNKIKDFVCALCSKKFISKSLLNNHLLTFHNNGNKITEMLHKCSYCSDQFVWKVSLYDHLVRVHNNSDVPRKQYNCEQCSFKTVMKSSFSIHKLKHGITDNLHLLKCYQCSFETYIKSYLKKHMKVHKNTKDFKCTYCSKKFTSKYGLNYHLSSIHKDSSVESHKYSKDLKCPQCSKGFKSKPNLNNHLLRIHKCKDNITAQIHACDKCSFESLHKSKLLTHQLKHGITDGKRTVKCSQCSFETYHHFGLSRHMKTHNNIKDFKCIQCSKEFKHKLSLNNHLLKVHKCKDNNTAQIHACDECSFETFTKCKLLVHKVTHGITDGFQIFKCYQCNYETYQKIHLIEHMARHQNIKHFKCKQCSKEFTSTEKLNNHLLKVHGFQILKCSQCSYETFKKHNLSQHNKRHENTKNVKCTQCSKEFIHKRYLNSHQCKGITEKK